jgi:hypothetical protein
MFYNPDLSFVDHVLVCFVLACWLGLVWASLLLCHCLMSHALRRVAYWFHGVRDGLG